MTQSEAMLAAKEALIALLQSDADLVGVQIAWSHPAGNMQRRAVIVGNSRRMRQEPGPPLGRGTREAYWRLEVAANVLHKGKAEDAAAQAVELAAAVERVVAANTDLGIPATILYAHVTDADLVETIRDGAREAEIPLDVTVRARLRTGA
ncbi:MAG: hypothetical protein KDB58_03495 [Solirubrobacterales bacterium]|nr:hypothetical protein [Solirubrobacterales bacterium]